MRKYQELDLGNENKLEYSSYVSCTWKMKYTELEIYLGKDTSSKIPYATTNLQTDYSNFESIAFCVWAKYPECKITLKYESIKWYENKQALFPLDYEKCEMLFENVPKMDSIRARMQHYMRFLYRVMKMQNLYGEHFRVDELNFEEIEVFTEEFEKRIINHQFVFTEPDGKSSISPSISLNENHLEKWFVYFSGTYAMEEKCPELILESSGNIKLYDQFPCGLFAGSEKNEKNRIFNKGAFDLWGVDKENNICLYELKKASNKRLGIISELFFYSCLMSDFKKIAPEKGTNLRGFSNFLQANNKIKAFFLIPEFHIFIEKNLAGVLAAMNARSDNVEYGVIRFNQEKIVGKDKEKFINKMKELYTNI